MAAEGDHIRACEVALSALYLRGGPNRERIERRRWVSLTSALRRREPLVETLAECARQEGFHDEAVVLDSPEILRWGECLVDTGRVVTALHPGYPARWVRILSSAAPPVLWRLECRGGGGPASGVGGPAPGQWHPAVTGGARQPFLGYVAVVGSRQVRPDVRRFAKETGETAAALGLSVISGNALGCDDAAMRGAASEGGRVVAILPHGLERLERRTSGVEYWSVCSPDEEFSRGAAMERNALIYASAASSVVVHARLREGGTWHGAIDAHRRKLTRLVARQDDSEPGNRALIALGAFPLKDLGDLSLALEAEALQPYLFE